MFDVGEPRIIRGEMGLEEFSGIESGESDSIAWQGSWDIWKLTMQTVKYYMMGVLQNICIAEFEECKNVSKAIIKLKFFTVMLGYFFFEMMYGRSEQIIATFHGLQNSKFQCHNYICR